MEKTKKSSLTNLAHVGVVVRDANKTIKALSPLSLGQIESFARPLKEVFFNGKPAEFKLNVFMINLGPIMIEMLEPVEGESPHKKFLDDKGEGIHHLAFHVNNLDSEVARLRKEGYKLILNGKWTDGDGGFAYLESGEESGFVFELMQG